MRTSTIRVLQSFAQPRSTTNPYLIQLAERLAPHAEVLTFTWRTALAGRYDVLHLHWPETLLRGRTRLRTASRQVRFALLLWRLRLGRTALVRTLHNTDPHDRGSWVERRLLRWCDRRTTLWIRLNPVTEPPTEAPVVTILHGHYRDWFARFPGGEPEPGRLLFFGLVRPYKGVEWLLTVFRALPDPQLRLRVVGRPTTPHLRSAVEQAEQQDSRVSSLLTYVDDAVLASEIARAGVVVLPYRELHNSGAALLALSLDRPILVPAGAAVADLAREVGPQWVTTFTGTLGPADLARAVESAQALPPGAKPDLAAREWPDIARAHAAAYAAARDRVRAGSSRSRDRRNAPVGLPRVEVVFRRERDAAGWAARHAAGEVPGRWPYGLDLLAATRAEVRAGAVTEPSRGRVALAALRRSRRAADHRRDIGVAWDENVARRMLVSAPHAEMYSGVIWLTDALTDRPEDRRARALLAALLRMDGLFVNSRAQVEPLRAAVGPGGPEVSFFRFGIDADFFRASPYPQRPLVVSVGGDRDRDPTTLFAALERVLARRPDVRVVVQSSSTAEPPAGVVKVAHLTHLELRELYESASVVAIATRANLHLSGLTVSLESMASARPVVLTATPGIADYVTDGENALLTPVGDPVALADRVLSLLDSPPAAQALAQRARAGIEEGLTSAHMVTAMARMLRLVD